MTDLEKARALLERARTKNAHADAIEADLLRHPPTEANRDQRQRNRIEARQARTEALALLNEAHALTNTTHLAR